MPPETLWRLAAVFVGLLGGLAGAAVSARLPHEAGEISSPLARRAALTGFGGLALGVWSQLALAGPVAVVGAGFGAALLLIAVIDAEHFWLPDILTLPLAAAGLAISVAFGPGRPLDHLIGAVAGFVALTAVAFAYRRLRGREGLGGGDPKLLGAIGAWVGWAGLPSVLVWASAAGLSWVLARRIARRAMKADDILPYGTLMALGAWLTWLFGPLGRAGW